MSKELKQFDLGKGQIAREKTCMDYTCKYCGAKATAGNFVANMCLQVFARHIEGCGAYVNSEEYSGYISECSTCRYYQNETCTR